MLLSQGVGAVVGMLITARLLNIIYSRQAKKDRGAYKPESRYAPQEGSPTLTVKC